MQMWFISDTHFGHENIIKYSQRPFANAREMDAALVANWNDRVKPQDHIYHLGDVTMNRGGKVQQDIFQRFIKQLHGHKRLILGNHDHFPIEAYLHAGIEKIYGTWRGIGDGRWVISHIPIHPGSMGSAHANIHGHIHQNPNPDPVLHVSKEGQIIVKPYVNLSVEVTNYAPIPIEEVQQRVAAIQAAWGSA